MNIADAHEEIQQLRRGAEVLETHIRVGRYLKWQDDELWLFEENGEGMHSGERFIDLLMLMGDE